MSITLHGQIAEIVDTQVEIGHYQSAEDLIYEALQALIKQKIDAGIDEGLADIEAGKFRELSPETIPAITQSIVANATQK